MKNLLPDEYLRLIARAYLAAPEYSDEAATLDEALELACTRLGVKSEDIVSSLVEPEPSGV